MGTINISSSLKQLTGKWSKIQMKGASSFEQFSAFIKHQKGGGGQAFQRSFV